MASKNAKQFVYRYNGVESSEEVELDRDGEIPTPAHGDILTRKGKQWKVIHVITQVAVAGEPAIPVVRVFLTDQLK